MENSWSIKKNNAGSTLILVVICTAYIAILCSALLSMTISNREMKTVERKAKENFYTAETALSEIRTGLENLAADALESAYIEVMERFIGNSEEDKIRLLEQTFLAELEAVLCDSPGSSRYRLELLGAMITNSSASFVTATGENILERDMSDPSGPRFLLLKNVKVSYLDADQYQTTIVTDIMLHTPEAGVVSRMDASQTFYGYGLIADRGISLHTAVGVAVNGNIYAGNDGIRLDNLSDLHIGNGDQVVTRGDISVRERSTLLIDGNPYVWARNILTGKGSSTEEQTSIRINGSCYVGDDLTLDAEASSVTLQGEYYGFSYGTNHDPGMANPLYAGNSSAILLNGRNSYLDLSGLRTLLISGRAYVDPALDGNSEADIYTGESITAKVNQAAYLVPAEYLWCGVNPVPEEIYSSYQSAPAGMPEVDFDKVLSTPYPVSLKDYADGFLNLFYAFSGGQRYVYYYLKFKSEAHANAYMQEYYRAYRNGEGSNILDFDRSMDRNVDRILVNGSVGSIISAGNIFNYQPTEQSSLLANTVDPGAIGGGTGNGAYPAMQQVAGQLADQYDCVCRTLEPVTSQTPFDESSIFNTILRTEELQSEVSGITTIPAGEYVVYLVNNAVGTPAEFDFTLPTDESLPNSGRKGIVIATGNVVVSGEYHGLILAGKEIRLNSGAVIHASESIIDTIIEAGNPDINRFFRTIPEVLGAGAGASVDRIEISDLITFQNWRRSED